VRGGPHVPRLLKAQTRCINALRCSGVRRVLVKNGRGERFILLQVCDCYRENPLARFIGACNKASLLAPLSPPPPPSVSRLWRCRPTKSSATARQRRWKRTGPHPPQPTTLNPKQKTQLVIICGNHL
jgi:hypothetical protein